MYCAKCGEELKSDSNFCGRCGMKVSKREEFIESVQKKKRSIGVTILGGYFVLQGIIAFGHARRIGYVGWAFVGLFLFIGIGLLKLYKASYLAAVILFVSVIVMSFSALVSRPNILGTPSMAAPVFGLIIGGLLLFFLSRKGTREQFYG